MIRIALPTLALLTACATTGSAEPREGPVAIGQTTYVDGPRVRPDKVIEDSRCPADVQCVWVGRLVLRATVTGGNWSKVLDLELGKPVHVADGALTLVEVTPQRMTGGAKPAKPEPYRFRFTFAGGY